MQTLRAESAADPDIWLDVVSVRIALLMNTVMPVRQEDATQTFNLLATELDFTDRLGRRVVTTTIPLRNRML
jgi:hypothetical protein